jgi:hypothetical protein
MKRPIGNDELSSWSLATLEIDYSRTLDSLSRVRSGHSIVR